MNRVLLIAAFATGTIALALSIVPRDPPLSPQPMIAPSGVTAEDLELLERRIDAVEGVNRDLLRRISELQHGAVGAPLAAGDAGAAPVAVQAELAQLRNDVRAMVAGEAMHSEGGKQWLKDTVREIQAEDMKARMEQQAARGAQRAEEQKAQWKKFVTDASLNYAQEQALMKAVDAEAQKRKALMDEVQAGTKTFRDVGRETRDLRRETDRTVKGQLDAAQGAKYDELRRAQGGPRRGDPFDFGNFVGGEQPERAR